MADDEGSILDVISDGVLVAIVLKTEASLGHRLRLKDPSANLQ